MVSAANLRLRSNASLRSTIVELQRELERIPQRMVEAKAVDRLSTLLGKVKVPFVVCFRGTEHSDAILGTIRHNHVCDWGAARIEDNAFDPPSKLGLFDSYELSNCSCRSHEEYAG